MSNDEQKPGVSGDEPSVAPETTGNAAPILIGFVVITALLVLMGWVTQP